MRTLISRVPNTLNQTNYNTAKNKCQAFIKILLRLIKFIVSIEKACIEAGFNNERETY